LSGRRGIRRQEPPGSGARITRLQAVRRLAHDLQRYGWPRLEMSMIVAVTGVCGFFASFVLLALGVEPMWQRYPLAVGIAYAVFLLELWLWMHVRGESDVTSFDIDFSGGAPPHDFGHGGSFGGGGATGSFDAPEPMDAFGDSFGAVGNVADVADGEGCVLVVVLAVLAAVAGGLLAAIYLVWGAPLLLAELLIDGALSYGLYRKLRKQERDFWLTTAVRRTCGVFLVAALFLSAAGAALAWHHPGARSLGEAMQAAPATPAEKTP